MIQSDPRPPRRIVHRAIVAASVLAMLGIGIAFGIRTLTHDVAPRFLTHYDRFPAIAHAPTRTVNDHGVAADPVNVAVVGSADEIGTAMRAAGWTVPAALSRASDLAIAKSVLLDRPDSAAPVSTLYLFGRAQDLAFEQEVGPSARRRHHVRLWRDARLLYGGRPVWLGGATYDARAGLSHRTLRPTHHIAPDIDEERDSLAAALARVGQVAATFRVTGLGIRVDAHNAEGDRFDTDGELRVIVISPTNARLAPPVDPGVPPLVALKDRLYHLAHRPRHDA